MVNVDQIQTNIKERLIIIRANETFRRYLLSIKNKFDGNNNVDHNQALNSAFDQC